MSMRWLFVLLAGYSLWLASFFRLCCLFSPSRLYCRAVLQGLFLWSCFRFWYSCMGACFYFFIFYLHLHLASVSGDHVRYHMHTVPVTHVNGVPGRVSCLLHFKLPFLFLSNETFTSPSIVFWSSFCSLISYSTFYFLLIGGFRARCIHSLAVSFACWRLRLQGSSSHSYTYSCS